MTVYVCPTRDIACGSNPAHWCHTCPQQHGPEPDCRMCIHSNGRAQVCYLILSKPAHCVNGEHFQPLPPVQLWRKT